MSQADDPIRSTVPDQPRTSRIEVDPTKSGLPPGENAISRPSGRAWMMVLAGGLLAGVAGFGLGEYALELLAPSPDLPPGIRGDREKAPIEHARRRHASQDQVATISYGVLGALLGLTLGAAGDRKSTRLNSSHANISYAVF